jgi:hypothetical protein
MTKTGSGQPVTLWSLESCEKFLTLAGGMVHHIEYDDDGNQAAIGTHLLEHFFGEQRPSPMPMIHGTDLRET